MQNHAIQTQLSRLTEAELMPASYEPPQYSEVELDDEELEEALRVAREKKFFILQREAWASKIREKESYRTSTAEQLFEQLVSAGITFANEKHESQVKQLCCYFSTDKRYAGDLTKGLLILGNIGNGKTTIMKLFSANQHHSYRVVHMIDLTADYKALGEPGVKPFNANFRTSPNLYGGTEYGYCFDDLGTEEIPARHYAESKNVFAEILQLRYNNRHLVPFHSTHATSNKTEEELQQIYGTRTYDRMKEMFNLHVFKHDSFR